MSSSIQATLVLSSKPATRSSVASSPEQSVPHFGSRPDNFYVRAVSNQVEHGIESTEMVPILGRWACETALQVTVCGHSGHTCSSRGLGRTGYVPRPGGFLSDR